MALANELDSEGIKDTDANTVTVQKDVWVNGALQSDGSVTATEEVMVAGDCHVKGTITDDALEVINRYTLHGTLEDLSAANLLYIAVPVNGYLLRVRTVLLGSVGGSSVALTPHVAGAAKTAANVTIAAGSLEGDVDVSTDDLDSSTGAVVAGDFVHLICEGSGNNVDVEVLFEMVREG